ncbi:MAG: hypothetical protein ACLQQ4_13755 [Bacteroidia bacterium]
MKTKKHRKKHQKKLQLEPKIPEIIPRPKEFPLSTPEKPDVIPPDFNPDKGSPEIFPINR